MMVFKKNAVPAAKKTDGYWRFGDHQVLSSSSSPSSTAAAAATPSSSLHSAAPPAKRGSETSQT